MYPEISIQKFEEKLRAAFDEALRLFAQWGRISVAERTPRALSYLMKVCDLLNDGEDIIDSLKTAFPPVNFSDSNSIQVSLSQTVKNLKTLDPVQSSGREYKIETDYLLSTFTHDGEVDDNLAQVAYNLIESEDKILDALINACDKLLEIILQIQAECNDANKPETLALLYTQEKARYIRTTWNTDGKTDELTKLEHHIKHRFPWGYPVTKEQIKTLYDEEYRSFVSTPLGYLYDNNGNDTIQLAVDIADLGCSRSELNEFFKQLLRLEEYISLGNEAESESPSSVTIGTNVEHAETVVIQNTDQLPCTLPEAK